MLDRVRRLLRSPTGARPGPGGTSAADGDAVLEGVYAAPGRIAHYRLDAHPRTLCGRDPTGLHRWLSGWYLVDVTRRCKRCDALVGDRGIERHGPPTTADTVVFGIEPAGLSVAEAASFRAHWEADAARRAGDPAPPLGTTFDDPPFVYARDPRRARGSSDSAYDRVLNDVYCRRLTGRKWHRVYETHPPREHPALAPSGRSFLFPCGEVGSDFDRDETGALQPLPLRTELPPSIHMCKACARSDARYGKLGDLPATRWDR